MGLQKGSAHFPTNQREWDQFTRDAQIIPDDGSVGSDQLKDNSVDFAKIQQVPADSVLGNQSGALANVGTITASSDNSLLIRRSGSLQFDVLADTDIPASIARDSEVTTAISSAITALEAQTDPFTQYLNQTRGDARYVQLSNVLGASATYDPPSLTTGSGATTTVTVTGAAMGDFVLCSFSNDLGGITVTCYVQSTNIVAVRFQNQTGGTIDLASGTLRVRVWKQ